MPEPTFNLRRKDRLPVIQAKWTITIAAILGVLVSLAQLTYEYQLVRHKFDSTFNQVLEALDQPASRAAYYEDRLYANELLIGLFEVKSVYKVEIYTKNNNLLAFRQSSLREGPYRKLVNFIFGPTTPYSLDLKFQPRPTDLFSMAKFQPAGRIQVELDTYSKGAEFFERAILIVGYGLARNFILALILLFVFHRIITHPFLHLVAELNNLSLEETSTQRIAPPNARKDEFSLLATTVNRLLDKIEENTTQRIEKVREAERLKTQISEQEKRSQEMLQYQTKLENTNLELETLLEQLEEAQGMLIESETMASLGRLVAGVAHELNTPLGVSVTANSYLKNRIRDLAKKYAAGTMTEKDFSAFLSKAKEHSDLLSVNIERATELITNFKKVAADQSYFERQKFNLLTYLKMTLASIEPELKKLKPELDIDCDPNINITGYPGAFSQVIINLIQNALLHAFHATAKNPKISIQAKLQDEEVQLILADNGKGIQPESLPHIFEPFFTTRRNQGGTGLGLNIVYSLVRQKMQGTISCESTLGEGTRFIINLPLISRAKEIQPPALT